MDPEVYSILIQSNFCPKYYRNCVKKIEHTSNVDISITEPKGKNLSSKKRLLHTHHDRRSDQTWKG